MRKIYYIFLISLTVASCASADKDYLVTIKTPYGDMKAILYDETPRHKENFLKLAREGFYDSTVFHRVMEDFMIQGGDPDSKGTAPGTPAGSGGPGYTLDAEFHPNLYHVKGALASARQPDNRNPQKESNGSQFYIVQGRKWTQAELTVDMEELNIALRQMMMQPRFDSLKNELRMIYETQGPTAYSQKLVEIKPLIEEVMKVDLSKKIAAERLKAYTTIGGVPHLDDEYTVFGKIIDGLEVIDRIAAIPTDRNNRPKENISMLLKVEEMSRKKISKEFGYNYPAEEE